MKISKEILERNGLVGMKLDFLGKIGRSLMSKQPRRRNIAMFHFGRSGSTVLESLIHQSPDFHWDGELLRGPNLMSQELLHEDRRYPFFHSKHFPLSPLQLISERVSGTNCQYYGFETKFYHVRSNGLNLAGYIAGLKHLGFDGFVILRRQNMLRKIVSSLILSQTKQSHLRSSESARLRKIEIDVTSVKIDRQNQSLLAFLRQWQSDFDEVERLLASEEVLHLSYEQHIQTDPRWAFGMFCDWLQIPRIEVEVQLRRSNPFPLTEIIGNSAEVADALHGTGFEWMLHEENP